MEDTKRKRETKEAQISTTTTTTADQKSNVPSSTKEPPTKLRKVEESAAASTSTQRIHKEKDPAKILKLSDEDNGLWGVFSCKEVEGGYDQEEDTYEELKYIFNSKREALLFGAFIIIAHGHKHGKKQTFSFDSVVNKSDKQLEDILDDYQQYAIDNYSGRAKYHTVHEVELMDTEELLKTLQKADEGDDEEESSSDDDEEAEEEDQ